MAQALRKLIEAPARSPERQALAERIEHVTALRDRLGRLRAGIEENQPYRAGAAVSRAEEALRVARETEVERERAKILGDPLPDGPSVDEAQRDFDAANAEYARRGKTTETLKRAEAATARELEYAEMGLRNAIAAVVAPAIGDLIARLEAAQRETAKLSRTLVTVFGYLDHEQIRAAQVTRDFYDVSADPAWRNWVAELERNPDAPAPEIETE